MTNLTKYQEVEIAEIVEDAIAVTPIKHRHQLAEAFKYLAYCSVVDQTEVPLLDIQELINIAKLDNTRKLNSMTRQINAEIAQLRGEMRSGFEKVAEVLTVIDERQHAIERRVEQLEQRPQPTVIINNTHHGTVPKELVIIAALTSLVGLLVLQQSMNVRDTWYLLHRQEVRR